MYWPINFRRFYLIFSGQEQLVQLDDANRLDLRAPIRFSWPLPSYTDLEALATVSR